MTEGGWAQEVVFQDCSFRLINSQFLLDTNDSDRSQRTRNKAIELNVNTNYISNDISR